MLSVFVVDDEAPARRKILRFLANDPEITIAGEAANGAEAVAGIRRTMPDLVLLDVQMPDMDGFDVLVSLGEGPKPEVIFATAYDQYALRAFEVHAFGYLLKPFDEERFREVIDRAKRRLAAAQKGDASERLYALLDQLNRRGEYPERVVLRTAERVVFVAAAEIDWIESARNHIVVHERGRTHVVRSTLEKMMESLDPRHFARISRSHVVNLGRIREMHPWFHGEYKVLLQDGTELTWTRRFLDTLPAGA